MWPLAHNLFYILAVAVGILAGKALASRRQPLWSERVFSSDRAVLEGRLKGGLLSILTSIGASVVCFVLFSAEYKVPANPSPVPLIALFVIAIFLVVVPLIMGSVLLFLGLLQRLGLGVRKGGGHPPDKPF